MHSELGVGVHVLIAAEALKETREKSQPPGRNWLSNSCSFSTGQRFSLPSLLQKNATPAWLPIKTEITLPEFGSSGSWTQCGQVLVRTSLQAADIAEFIASSGLGLKSERAPEALV